MCGDGRADVVPNQLSQMSRRRRRARSTAMRGGNGEGLRLSRRLTSKCSAVPFPVFLDPLPRLETTFDFPFETSFGGLVVLAATERPGRHFMFAIASGSSLSVLDLPHQRSWCIESSS